MTHFFQPVANNRIVPNEFDPWRYPSSRRDDTSLLLWQQPASSDLRKVFIIPEFCNFMVTKRFSRTDSTENQSCSQLLRRCTYQVTFRLSSCLTTTLLTCQLILLLTNHSACFSRNFIAMNFIVKSTIINVSSLFKVSTIYRLYWSWFSARRIFPISLCTQK